MKIHQGIQSVQDITRPVVTIGMFDGVHLGHQALFNLLKTEAKKIDGETVLLTFTPHPREFLQKDFELKQLTPLDEKLEHLEKIGLDHVIIQNFDKEFSRQSSTEFVRNGLVGCLNVKVLMIGHDHQFGRNREGNFEQLKELSELYRFDLQQLEAVQEENITISSTKIRKALNNGNLDFANAALGRKYRLEGQVVKGDGRGKGIGFPTANLLIHSSKLIPKKGVYEVKTEVNNQLYRGMMNIGNKPTFGENQLSVEINLFDFQDDIYGDFMQVDLVKFIREERKFENIEDLKQQLELDKKTILGA